MDITGTDYVTSYSYDLANHLTTITQGSLSRTFKTDFAGHTIAVTEPGRGTTQYSYAYNGTRLQVTRTRPKANQTNPSVVTHTTLQYDSLSRLVTTSYDDGLTPTLSLYYDSSPSGLQWSTTPQNTRGRLAGTLTGSSGGATTRSQFSYDVSGNMKTMWQCAPSICGTSGQESRSALTFTYDLANNPLSENDTVSGLTTYVRSPAWEVTQITNTGYRNTYNPSTLVSNVVNGPRGPTSYSLGNGLSSVRSWFKRIGTMIFGLIFLLCGLSWLALAKGSPNIVDWLLAVAVGSVGAKFIWNALRKAR